MAWGLWLIEVHGTPVGAWLVSHDPDFWDVYPTGDIVHSPDPAEAQRFNSPMEALAEWKRASTRVPLRPDGRPNRPLTAFTAEPKKLPTAADFEASGWPGLGGKYERNPRNH
jgi:hypothetical protein